MKATMYAIAVTVGGIIVGGVILVTLAITWMVD